MQLGLALPKYVPEVVDVGKMRGVSSLSSAGPAGIWHLGFLSSFYLLPFFFLPSLWGCGAQKQLLWRSQGLVALWAERGSAGLGAKLGLVA